MKVMIVGPVVGGSLPVARATAAAFTGLGLDSVFLDYSPFEAEYHLSKESGDSARTMAFLKALEDALTDQVERYKPDVLLGIAQAPLFNRELLVRLRGSGVILAFWFVEDFRVLGYWRSMAPCFDIFFAIQKEEFRQALSEIGAFNHYYLPVAFDNNLDVPVKQGDDLRISFMGAPYPNRVAIFQRLGLSGLRIFGAGWDRHSIDGVVIGDRRITELEARWIYKHSRINLNLHSSMEPAKIGGGFVNPRTFELAGLGCFQLCDRRALLPDLYPEDEVIQFSSEEELVELVHYYLERDAERAEIAMRARRRTLRNHLYEHRVREIMEAVQKM